MTRREFTDQIAYEYATFERDTRARHGADVSLAPLDRRFAFSVGRGYIEHGSYTPRKDYRGLDWAAIAREARKALPRTRRAITEFAQEAS